MKSSGAQYDLWDVYRRDGYEAVLQASVSAPLEYFLLTLIAFREGDFEMAQKFAFAAAARERDHVIYHQAMPYLDRIRDKGIAEIYVDPEAFKAFIRGGSNVPLYQETSAALRRVYDEYESLSVLDIGVGDGLSLLPALTPAVRRLDILDPSATLLDQASTQLRERGLFHTTHNMPIQEFIKHSNRHWDVIQATYSLQSLPPHDRLPVLHWIKNHCDRLLIVEFDAPAFPDPCSAELVRYATRRYEFGINEYPPEERELIAQGFLLPLLFGYFDPNTPPANYERPIKEWRADLYAVGFETVNTSLIYSYWWANSHLLDARISTDQTKT